MLDFSWLQKERTDTMGPKTFIFRGSYNSYIGGLKPSFFMVLGSKGTGYNTSRDESI